jgi:hypothetical protein
MILAEVTATKMAMKMTPSDLLPSLRKCE